MDEERALIILIKPGVDAEGKEFNAIYGPFTELENGNHIIGNYKIMFSNIANVYHGDLGNYKRPKLLIIE